MGSFTPPVSAGGSYTGPTETLDIVGVLSDFDGTIVDSTDAVEKHWHDIAADLGVDAAIILQTSHGRRSIDTLRIHAPHKATTEYVQEIEAALPLKFGKDVKILPGGADMLALLSQHRIPWAIVTSGTRALMDGWISALNLARPPQAVNAEDVDEGKPDPTCYLLGLDRIGLDRKAVGTQNGQKKVLVLEDAPAGVRAGKAAGCFVLGLGTTHSVQSLRDAGADCIVKDLDSLKIKSFDGSVATVQMDNVWVQD